MNHNFRFTIDPEEGAWTNLVMGKADYLNIVAHALRLHDAYRRGRNAEGADYAESKPVQVTMAASMSVPTPARKSITTKTGAAGDGARAQRLKTTTVPAHQRDLD